MTFHPNFEKNGATIFQQDSASATQPNLSNSGSLTEVFYINDWQVNNPDINPIVNLWAIRKKDIHGKDVRSQRQLRSPDTISLLTS